MRRMMMMRIERRRVERRGREELERRRLCERRRVLRGRVEDDEMNVCPTRSVENEAACVTDGLAGRMTADTAWYASFGSADAT
jgi:hypothetical protein